MDHSQDDDDEDEDNLDRHRDQDHDPGSALSKATAIKEAIEIVISDQTCDRDQVSVDHTKRWRSESVYCTR